MSTGENGSEKRMNLQPETGNLARIRELIAWAAAGAADRPAACTCTDWEELAQLAAQHHVLPLAACAVKRAEEETCPKQIREMLTGVVRRTSAENMIRRQRMVYLIDEMTKAGVDALVLKGYTVAADYAHPECRDSADVDLLIDPGQEKKAIAFLREHGFTVEARAMTSQHAVCVHPQYGKLELHVSLYAELVREVWFQGMSARALVCEPPVLCSTPDGTFKALGYTDHLIFLALHMIKHFIESGLTIRMMLDIALFFSHHAQQIDAERFWKVMHDLQYDALISSVLWVMIRCAGFGKACFPGIAQEDAEQMDAILEDLAQGGYMGALQKERRYEAGMEYNRRRMLRKRNGAQYRAYMLRWKIRTASKYMFMSFERLSGMHPFLRKAPVLYPFVWIWQMLAYPVGKIRSGILKTEVRAGGAKMTPEAKRRVALFETLHML